VVDLRYLAGNEGGAKMSNLEELVFLDATAQAELVRRKEIKPNVSDFFSLISNHNILIFTLKYFRRSKISVIS